jgi:hypothetical protein
VYVITCIYMYVCNNLLLTRSFILHAIRCTWGGYGCKDKVDDVKSTTFIEIEVVKVARVHFSLVCSLWRSERYSARFRLPFFEGVSVVRYSLVSPVVLWLPKTSKERRVKENIIKKITYIYDRENTCTRYAKEHLYSWYICYIRTVMMRWLTHDQSHDW